MPTDFSNPFTVTTEKFYEKSFLSMHLHYHKYVADLPRKANKTVPQISISSH